MPNAYQPCLACGKGDVITGFVLEGEPGFVQAKLIELVGLSDVDAAEQMADREGPQALRVRLCRPCSRQTGARVATLGTAKVPHYKPEGWQG